MADSLRFGRIGFPVYIDDYRYKALQNLNRTRFYTIQNLTREKQRFMNYIFMKCSGLAQEKVFSSNYGATALAVFEEFETPDELANMDIAELTAFIAEKGKNRFPHPDEIVKAVQAQIKALDKEIERQLENIPNTLTSVPGIGPVISAGIIAEVGDINRFESQAQLAKYAGLAWKENKSGMLEGQHTCLIRSGNRFLKYYLCEAAFALVRCDTEYKRFYDLKYKEVNKFQHKRALALTARKLVRLVFRLLKDNRLYRPA